MPANDIPTRAERILQYKKDIREAEREKKRYMQAIEEKRKQLDRMDNPFEGQYLFDKYMAMSEEEDANYIAAQVELMHVMDDSKRVHNYKKNEKSRLLKLLELSKERINNGQEFGLVDLTIPEEMDEDSEIAKQYAEEQVSSVSQSSDDNASDPYQSSNPPSPKTDMSLG